MSKIKDLSISILHTEVMGWLFIILNKYLTNAPNYLPNSFIQNKTIFEQYGIVIILFIFLGIVQYYVVNLYNKMNWKKASLIDYIVEVIVILAIFLYLDFITTIVNFISIFAIITVLFITRFLYYYNKFSKIHLN